MPLITILGFAVGLALDAFAVAVVAGAILPRITARHYFRLGFHFGLFQALMPVLGWLAGSTIADYAQAWDHWIAFGLLAAVGCKMLLEKGGGERSAADPTRGLTLVVLSIATSMDALAVGLSLALLGVRIVRPALVIGVVACAFTCVGLALGRRVGKRVGVWAQRIGGVVLIGIGIKIVVEHLSGQ